MALLHDMEIIDLNSYWGGWPFWPVTVRTPLDLLALMDANGIGRAAMSSLKAVFVDCTGGNDDLARLSAATNGRVIPYLVVNPVCEAETFALLDAARPGSCRGFSLFPLYHGYSLDEDLPGLNTLLARAAAWGWPVLVPVRLAMHFWLPALGLDAIGKLATRHPDVRFVLGAVNYEARQARAWLRRLPNLCVELSADQQLDAVTAYVDAAGIERVCLGTGLVLQQPAPGVIKVLQSDLPMEARRMVAGGNAARLLNLAREHAIGSTPVT